ncbi:type III-B CRISPR module-associated protein Cmr3 [Paenibacillus sp. 1001270B_150601_E10]|uniref:type III-B CRISPR module-associated protein Cmr3 n=1 Tax=Paenibacillus sp. 1001270B_150601_E10 TaxID=2787079 RepID=UPI001E43AFB5|nr:type III-B CRISPR module-associated protein Cmr3 [Paenibacillus sp. 1001270B_150601_E10]
MNVLKIRPIDPLMIRDGRPFEAAPGVRAHTMTDVVPSTLAGSIRTLLGKVSTDSSLSEEDVKQLEHKNLHRIVVRGPLYEYKGIVYYPIPQDVGFYTDKDSGELCVNIRRPALLNEGEGYFGTGRNGLYDQMWPALSAHKHKPAMSSPSYMSAEWMTRWLCDLLTEKDWRRELSRWDRRAKTVDMSKQLAQDDSSEKGKAGLSFEDTDHFLSSFPVQETVHTAIQPDSRTAKDKMLFSTESLILPDGMNLLAEIDVKLAHLKWPVDLSEIHSLGGKRGLAHFYETEQATYWSCPTEILDALHDAGDPSYIRMVLATPAYFSKGWLPGGFNEQLVYENAWGSGVDLQLCWACVPRWQPVSGWHHHLEEKSVRRMVPAGSVYFFKVLKGDAQDLVTKNWLKSVSDLNRRKEAFDKDDGFGLALWGLWSPMILI